MRKKYFSWAIAAIAALGPTALSAGEAEDKEFAKQVAVALKESGQMRDYSIGVKCKNGTVWMAGRVTDKRQLSSALQIVSNLDGVQQIVNNVAVDEPGATAASTRLRQPGMPADQSMQQASMQQAMPTTGRAPSNVSLASGTMQAPAQMQPQQARSMPRGTPRAFAPAGGAQPPAGYTQLVNNQQPMQAPVQQAGFHGHHGGGPMPAYVPGTGGGIAPPAYDQPHMPNYSWPSYAAYPNYAALSYPKQYSASAWPFIGPFYPYPQVPLGWRKVSLEWDDGWWFLDFDDQGCH